MTGFKLCFTAHDDCHWVVDWCNCNGDNDWDHGKKYARQRSVLSRRRTPSITIIGRGTDWRRMNSHPKIFKIVKESQSRQAKSVVRAWQHSSWLETIIWEEIGLTCPDSSSWVSLNDFMIGSSHVIFLSPFSFTFAKEKTMGTGRRRRSCNIIMLCVYLSVFCIHNNRALSTGSLK